MSDRTEAHGGHAEFVKALTLTDATMLVAGSMIGSGIFIVSADMARDLQSPGLLLAAWGLTALMTVLGALVAITAGYVVATEVAKPLFYRRVLS